MFGACKNLERKNAPEELVYPVDFGEVTIVANPAFKGSAHKLFEIKHTRLELKPIWQQRSIQGAAELTVSAFAYPQDTLVLDARNFDIESISLAKGKSAAIKIAHIYNGRKIVLPLPQTWQPGQEHLIRIVYTARPEHQLAKGIIKSKNDQGLFFIDPDDTDPVLPKQLWTQGEVRNNSAWFPTIDEPNQKFTQEILLTVDSSMETLSNGTLVFSNINKDGTRTDFWQQKKPHSAYLAMIAAGDWHIERDKWRDSIPVEYYVEHAYAPYAKLIFGNTPEMMEYFSKLFGVDYPWEKYSQVVVREFVSGAMENTTATVHFEPVQHDGRAHLDETYESIIAHELVHHWFGDLVTAEKWGDLALNESFATYGERLWEEYKYGPDAAAYGRAQDLSAYLAETVYTKESIINYYYNDPEELFDRHRYEKGALVLHMLRTLLGNEVFYKALNTYLRQNTYKNTEIHQLRIAFEDASGQDLNWFFDQWFHKAGHPSLVIKHNYNKDKNTVTLHIEQNQSGKNVPVFKIPADVHIYTPGKILQRTVWLGKSKDSFVFEADGAPLLVNFDAQKYLLAQKVEIKPAAQWYFQFMNAKNLADRTESLQALGQHTAAIGEDSLKNLVTKALADSFWSIRSMAINTLLANCSAGIQKNFAPQLKTMAQKDKSSHVRFAAVIYLLNYSGLHKVERPGAASEIINIALSDSSYRVVAAGINGLKIHTSAAELPKALALAAPFEKYRNSDVLFALAQFYAERADSTRLPFFHNMAQYLQTGEYGRFTDVYRRYLENLPATVLVREKDFILSLSPKIKDLWARISYKAMLQNSASRLRSLPAHNDAKKAADDFVRTAESILVGSE